MSDDGTQPEQTAVNAEQADVNAAQTGINEGLRAEGVQQRAMSDALLVRADSIAASLDEIADRLELAEKNQRHTSRIVRAGAWLIALALIAIAVASFALVRLNGYAQYNRRLSLRVEANAAHIERDFGSAAKQLCESRNEVAKGQLKLWDGIIALNSQANPTTPEVLARFRVLLAQTFRMRDCTLPITKINR